MANNQWTPNPLRPYYVPPAHDFLTGKLSSATSSASATLASSSARNVTAAASPSYISSATRDMLSDLDYSEYLETPSVTVMIRDMIDTAVMRYTSVLILQPFKVAKTVMQCQYVPRRAGGLSPNERITELGSSSRQGSEVSPGFAEYGGEWGGKYNAEESDDDDPPYFTSNDNVEETGSWAGSQRRKRERDPSRGRKMTDRSGRIITDATNAEHSSDKPEHAWQIKTKKVGSVADVLGAIWNKEGIWGVWKGSNSTFVYTILTSTIEAWTQSFLSAVINIPDPSITEVIDSPSPVVALCVIVASSAITALLLAPLDIVRTRIIMAPADDKPRTVLPLLKSLPSYLCPPALALPTALHAALPSFMTAGVPYYLRVNYGIDPVVRPAIYTMCTFVSSTAELFVRLPLETSLRRGQLAVAAPRKTIVPAGSYYGSFGTLWSIYKTEESGGSTGIEGLYRGWKVGMWGLLGTWAMGVFGGAANSSVSGAPF
ncbi:hypothetical protein H072_7544 [Dactylellina haptotyla CBS 200.50]|uniref:Mitochondrial fusion and transport protein ugo1 n=1 Tax=Dactylellina haptotyla (strain CBS 200.50) TaxID=1284197 RepID=S8A6S6_DACHA|nr:hypothetical protein H072_7544 [Dactylellina haptotyla CBS 200.50]